jgi:hypothetical protein
MLHSRSFVDRGKELNRLDLKCFVIIGSAFAVLTANAHHAAIGLYDRSSTGEIEGEVASIVWRNPHVRLEIVRTDNNGNKELWEVEFGGINTLERLGVSRDQIKIGDRIRVSGNLGRDGRKAIFSNTISIPGGGEVAIPKMHARYGITEAALANARSVASELRENIFRVWLPYSRPDTGAGTTEYPLTDAGRATLAEWNPAEDPALQCIPPGLMTAMDNPFPVEFVDQGDVILMRLEEWDGVRTIFVNEENVGTPVQPRMGVSVGRLEGDTLFVKTTDIAWGYIDNLGTPQSNDAVVEEAFTLSDDGTRLAWEAKITDPVNFTEPVVMAGEWVWLPDKEVKPFNCAVSNGE